MKPVLIASAGSSDHIDSVDRSLDPLVPDKSNSVLNNTNSCSSGSFDESGRARIIPIGLVLPTETRGDSEHSVGDAYSRNRGGGGGAIRLGCGGSGSNRTDSSSSQNSRRICTCQDRNSGTSTRRRPNGPVGVSPTYHYTSASCDRCISKCGTVCDPRKKTFLHAKVPQEQEERTEIHLKDNPSFSNIRDIFLYVSNNHISESIKSDSDFLKWGISDGSNIVSDFNSCQGINTAENKTKTVSDNFFSYDNEIKHFDDICGNKHIRQFKGHSHSTQEDSESDHRVNDEIIRDAREDAYRNLDTGTDEVSNITPRTEPLNSNDQRLHRERNHLKDAEDLNKKDRGRDPGANSPCKLGRAVHVSSSTTASNNSGFELSATNGNELALTGASNPTNKKTQPVHSIELAPRSSSCFSLFEFELPARPSKRISGTSSLSVDNSRSQ